MSKVFVVGSGEYSDFGINAVFDSREQAEAYINALAKPQRWGENVSIFEMELNPDMKEIKAGRSIYFVTMDINGNVLNEDGYRVANLNDFSEGDRLGFNYSDNMELYCFATDEKHAIKIANEIRAQLIANNGWGRVNFQKYNNE